MHISLCSVRLYIIFVFVQMKYIVSIILVHRIHMVAIARLVLKHVYYCYYKYFCL